MNNHLSYDNHMTMMVVCWYDLIPVSGHISSQSLTGFSSPLTHHWHTHNHSHNQRSSALFNIWNIKINKINDEKEWAMSWELWVSISYFIQVDTVNRLCLCLYPGRAESLDYCYVNCGMSVFTGSCSTGADLQSLYMCLMTTHRNWKLQD